MAMINNGGTTLDHNTRTRWHRTFCINELAAGSANACGFQFHIGHNWRYWSETKFLPPWDTDPVMAGSKISEMVNSFNTANCGGALLKPYSRKRKTALE